MWGVWGCESSIASCSDLAFFRMEWDIDKDSGALEMPNRMSYLALAAEPATAQSHALPGRVQKIWCATRAASIVDLCISSILCASTTYVHLMWGEIGMLCLLLP